MFIYLHIKQLNEDSVQFFILFQLIVDFGRFVASGSVFQSTLPLNFNELLPYLTGSIDAKNIMTSSILQYHIMTCEL